MRVPRLAERKIELDFERVCVSQLHPSSTVAYPDGMFLPSSEQYTTPFRLAVFARAGLTSVDSEPASLESRRDLRIFKTRQGD